MKPSEVHLVIKTYKIKSTGADGGRYYVSTEIEHKGKPKKLTVLFADKSDENKLAKAGTIKVKGDLLDQGHQHDLIMSNATLIP